MYVCRSLASPFSCLLPLLQTPPHPNTHIHTHARARAHTHTHTNTHTQRESVSFTHETLAVFWFGFLDQFLHLLRTCKVLHVYAHTHTYIYICKYIEYKYIYINQFPHLLCTCKVLYVYAFAGDVCMRMYGMETGRTNGECGWEWEWGWG